MRPRGPGDGGSGAQVEPVARSRRRAAAGRGPGWHPRGGERARLGPQPRGRPKPSAGRASRGRGRRTGNSRLRRPPGHRDSRRWPNRRSGQRGQRWPTSRDRRVGDPRPWGVGTARPTWGEWGTGRDPCLVHLRQLRANLVQRGGGGGVGGGGIAHYQGHQRGRGAGRVRLRAGRSSIVPRHLLVPARGHLLIPSRYQPGWESRRLGCGGRRLHLRDGALGRGGRRGSRWSLLKRWARWGPARSWPPDRTGRVGVAPRTQAAGFRSFNPPCARQTLPANRTFCWSIRWYSRWTYEASATCARRAVILLHCGSQQTRLGRPNSPLAWRRRCRSGVGAVVSVYGENAWVAAKAPRRAEVQVSSASTRS